MQLNYIQFAKDYNFKKAWIVTPKDRINDGDISNYLNDKNYKNLCCEIFLDSKGSYLIVGFTCVQTDHKKFIRDSMEFGSSSVKIDKYIKDTSIVEPDLVRVGILDYWYRTGLAVIWQKGDKKRFSLIKIETLLENTPQLLETDLKPQGMSFYYAGTKNTPEHWIMFDVSIKKQNKYLLDKDRMLSLLKQNLNPSSPVTNFNR